MTRPRRAYTFAALLAAVTSACGGGEGGDLSISGDGEGRERDVPDRAVLLSPTDPAWGVEAPDSFVVTFETTRGDFQVEVVRAWAPVGSDRFYNLVRLGYYDDARFHRVVPGFITQWGVAGDPEVTAVWYERGMSDDPVVSSNVRGSIAYAFTDPGTRSTQVYINMVDNRRLDEQGFAPFGRVIEGMGSVVDSIFGEYGETSGGGVRQGQQDSLVARGNAYLDADFPRLDRLIRAYVSSRSEQP